MTRRSAGQSSSAEGREADSLAALTEELRETAQALKEGSFSPQATIRFDSGSMGVTLGWCAALFALLMLVILIIVVVWLNGEINSMNQRFTDLNNNDRVHDAYIRQYGDRLSRVESTKEQKPAK